MTQQLSGAQIGTGSHGYYRLKKVARAAQNDVETGNASMQTPGTGATS